MIKNVKNAGTITRDSKFAAGIVGLAHGKVTVSGCDLTVTINFNVNGDGTHGGIVGLTGDCSNMTVEGCYFRGFVKGYSIIGCGGIVGFARYRHTVKDCMLAAAEFTPTQSSIITCYYFDKNEEITTLQNNYYLTSVYGNTQGKQAFAVTADDNIDIGFGEMKGSYPASGSTDYNVGSALSSMTSLAMLTLPGALPRFRAIIPMNSPAGLLKSQR